MAPDTGRTVLLLSAFSFVSALAQQALTACPTTETIVQDSTGNSWAVCPNTDYNWASASWIGGVASPAACADYCTRTQGCTRAVWDQVGGWCHAKAGDSGLWDQNNQYAAIRPYSGAITTCPGVETNVTDSQGRTWSICPNSDYQGASNNVVANVASSKDCMNLCATTAGCVKGVYDHTYSYCHIKSNQVTWATSQQYDTIRLVADATNANAKTSFTCNTQQSILTTTDGSTFALCVSTDFQGTSIYVLPNYASDQACAEACSLTPICTNAIWDKKNQVCHIKGPVDQLTQAQNAQYDQIRLIKKAAPVSQAASAGGKWSDVIPFPIVPAAVYVVPQQPYASRLMAFSADSDESFGAATGLTQFADFNYQSLSVSQRTVSNTQHNMFCPGISVLQNGNVVVTGGNDASTVSIYDPVANGWTRAANMNMGRGYQASTILSNGKVFTIGGSFSGSITTKNGEVYDPATNKWTMLNGASADALNTRDTTWRRDNHAWLYGWSNGNVFHAGPSSAMLWYGTSGTGSTSSAGTRNATADAMCGINVMYDTGKILAAGGSPLYDDSMGVTTSYIITVPSVGGTATVQKAQDLKYPRAFANSVVLPDGTVLVTGGQKRTRQFTDIEAFVYPELFNPKTNTWKVMNAQAIPRNYHSVSVLLGDGTIFTGGGGLCYTTVANDPNSWNCDPSAQHLNGEIFSPPYLFNADGSAATRPSITSVATTQDSAGNFVRAGGKLTVKMNDSAATTFSLVRLGSATHSVNTDQRRLSLTAIQSGSSYSITLPSDNGILLPGYWYLFAMNKAGTPSIARVIQVKL